MLLKHVEDDLMMMPVRRQLGETLAGRYSSRRARPPLTVVTLRCHAGDSARSILLCGSVTNCRRKVPNVCGVQRATKSDERCWQQLVLRLQPFSKPRSARRDSSCNFRGAAQLPSFISAYFGVPVVMIGNINDSRKRRRGGLVSPPGFRLLRRRGWHPFTDC